MISSYFTTSFGIERMLWYDETSELQSTVSFFGHIQQANAELAQSLGLAYTKTYTIWCPVSTPVQNGDVLSQGSDTYSVRAINERNYAGGNQHLKLIVEKDETYLD